MSNLTKLLLEGQKIRPVTKHLVERLCEDQPLTPAASVDFGVESKDHYYALSKLFRGSIAHKAHSGDTEAIKELRKRVIALDEACGNGAKLNALVRTYAPEFAEVIHFHTSWDEILGRAETEITEKG